MEWFFGGSSALVSPSVCVQHPAMKQIKAMIPQSMVLTARWRWRCKSSQQCVQDELLMLLGTKAGHPLALPVSSATSLGGSSASVQACWEWCCIWHENMKDLDKTLMFQATGKKKNRPRIRRWLWLFDRVALGWFAPWVKACFPGRAEHPRNVCLREYGLRVAPLNGSSQISHKIHLLVQNRWERGNDQSKFCLLCWSVI